MLQCFQPKPHRCAIVVSLANAHAWNLAAFYEGIVTLHSPETVIVFGTPGIARTWLGVDNVKSDKSDAGDGK